MTIFEVPPPLVVVTHADAKHFGGFRETPRLIILHATAGTNSLAYLTTTSPPSNPVSVHSLIEKDGTNNRLVHDWENAWHAGRGTIGGGIGPAKGQTNLNTVSLGIELENLNTGTDPYPDTQIAACASQIVFWWGKYGFLPVLSHASVDPRKTDPAGFPWDTLWMAVYQRLGGALLPTVLAGVEAARVQLVRVQQLAGGKL